MGLLAQWRLNALVVLAATIAFGVVGVSVTRGSAVARSTVAASTTRAGSTARLYWVNNGIHINQPLVASVHTIGVANLDGTNVNERLVTSISFPDGMAVNGRRIYWTDPVANTIGNGEPRRHRREQTPDCQRQVSVGDRRLRPLPLLGQQRNRLDRPGEH